MPIKGPATRTGEVMPTIWKLAVNAKPPDPVTGPLTGQVPNQTTPKTANEAMISDQRPANQQVIIYTVINYDN